VVAVALGEGPELVDVGPWEVALWELLLADQGSRLFILLGRVRVDLLELALTELLAHDDPSALLHQLLVGDAVAGFVLTYLESRLGQLGILLPHRGEPLERSHFLGGTLD